MLHINCAILAFIRAAFQSVFFFQRKTSLECGLQIFSKIFLRGVVCALLSLTFDNSCVGHDPSTIDVAPASAAASAQHAAGVPHPAPAAPATRRPRRNSRVSRCLPRKKINHTRFGDSFVSRRRTDAAINPRRYDHSNVRNDANVSNIFAKRKFAFLANITRYYHNEMRRIVNHDCFACPTTRFISPQCPAGTMDARVQTRIWLVAFFLIISRICIRDSRVTVTSPIRRYHSQRMGSVDRDNSLDTSWNPRIRFPRIVSRKTTAQAVFAVRAPRCTGSRYSFLPAFPSSQTPQSQPAPPANTRKVRLRCDT